MIVPPSPFVFWREEMRIFRRSAVFSIFAVTTLALGIGSISSVSTLISQILLKPPPYAEAERLVLILVTSTDDKPYAQGCAAGQLDDWQRQLKNFQAVAGYQWDFDFLIQRDGSESVTGLAVTKEYFQVLGINPMIGAPFQAEDTTPGQPARVIILGNELWLRKFGGDTNILGKTVRLSRESSPLEVIGVMPRGLRFLPSPSDAHKPNYDVNSFVDYWLPVSPDVTKPKQTGWNAVGRLKRDADIATVQAELDISGLQQARQDADFEGLRPVAKPVATIVNDEARHLIMPMFGVVCALFLIVCTNTSGLLVSRGIQRQQEFAVRSALGATPWALFAYALREALWLALAGSLLGFGLAIGIIKALKLSSCPIPRLDEVTFGWIPFAYALSFAVVGGLISGSMPALSMLQMRSSEWLKAGRTIGAGTVQRRILGILTVIQIAITLGLLTGAGLLIRTVQRITAIQPGYDTANVLIMNVIAVGDASSRRSFDVQALTRVPQIPGVQKAALAFGVPLTGNRGVDAIEIEGQAETTRLKDAVSVPTRFVTEAYFECLGMALRDGRSFRSSDVWNESSNPNNTPFVAIVNVAFAEQYFEGRRALGRSIRVPGWLSQPATIVGIIENTRNDALIRRPEPEIYFSFWQVGAFAKDLIVRSKSDPHLLGTTIIRELRAIDPTVVVENIRTLEEVRTGSIMAHHIALRLLVVLSIAATGLALLGIYGTLSITAVSKRAEIGIRMAFGATRSHVLRMIVQDGLKLVAIGAVLGVALALGFGQALKGFLFEIPAADPITLILMVALFSALALLASWLPARRAAKGNPLEVLRNS